MRRRGEEEESVWLALGFPAGRDVNTSIFCGWKGEEETSLKGKLVGRSKATRLATRSVLRSFRSFLCSGPGPPLVYSCLNV